MKLSNHLSATFRVASLIATILVVAIHYNTRHFIPAAEAMGWNALFQNFFSNGLARIAVPYFAFSAGLFFYLGNDDGVNYKKNIRSRVRTLVVPYLLCLVIILIPESIYLRLFTVSGYELSIFHVLNDMFVEPIAVQFWFLRDLIVLMVLSPLIAVLSRRYAIATLSILCIVWFIDYEPFPKIASAGRPIISIEVLLFYCAGCFYSMQNAKRISTIIAKSTLVTYLATFYVILVFAVRAVLENSHLAGSTAPPTTAIIFLHKTGILVGIVALLLLSSKIKSSTLIRASSYNFFVYLFHGIPLIHVITYLSDKFIPDIYKFYSNFPISLLITFASAVILQRILPTVYGWLTGGR